MQSKYSEGGLRGRSPPSLSAARPLRKKQNRALQAQRRSGPQTDKKNVSDIQIYQALHQYGCRRLHSKRYSVEREEHYIKYKFMLFCPLGVPSLSRYWCCNQNIRFVFCDFRRRRKSQKTKPGPASAKTFRLSSG